MIIRYIFALIIGILCCFCVAYTIVNVCFRIQNKKDDKKNEI